MTYRRLTDLPAAVRGSGLPVVLVSGWQNRGRPASTGGFNPRGVVVHHTGDTIGNNPARERSYAAGTLAQGFASLPGPLCQLGLGRNGTVYVIAAGRANHAGASRNSGFMRSGDGNSQAIGIEAMNSGFEGWTATQLNAYHRLCAALCDHYGWPRSHVRAHGETSTTGKWDPGINHRLINMTTFRRGVAAIPRGGSMAITQKEADRIAKAVWNYKMAGRAPTGSETAGQRLRAIRYSTRNTNDAAGPVISVLRKIAAKVGA